MVNNAVTVPYPTEANSVRVLELDERQPEENMERVLLIVAKTLVPKSKLDTLVSSSFNNSITESEFLSKLSQGATLAKQRPVANASKVEVEFDMPTDALELVPIMVYIQRTAN
jgi:hypothetical protein